LNTFSQDTCNLNPELKDQTEIEAGSETHDRSHIREYVVGSNRQKN